MPNRTTKHFYRDLRGFRSFPELTDIAHYRPLPDDWVVAVTDVRGSTEAIHQGKYKEVNAVGIASIVAIINALKPLPIPYVFSGDGAVACFPEKHVQLVTPALAATRKMALRQFDLFLRIGVVPMHEIRKAGHEVAVGKLRPHPHYEQAMLRGSGVSFAEKLVKTDTSDNPYIVPDPKYAGRQMFGGFECRWKEIPSPHEENISLLVQAISDDVTERDRTYRDILGHIDLIYGSEEQYHPLREDALTLTASMRRLSVEAGIRTAFEARGRRVAYLFKLQVLRIVGWWFMSRGVKTDSADWGQYKRNLILNTDFRKFDEALRMVIAGSTTQRQQLRAILERYSEDGRVAFGIHAAPAALITCIVSNYDKGHVHFVDGASGGYAMASRELKRQLNELNSGGE